MEVAPDASSRAAGRRLAVPGPWSGTGTQGALLWGECQGSGSTPYQVTVDVAARRWKCSCPSRKFPCKHALGLLLLWADGRLDESGTLTDFAERFARSGAARSRSDDGSPADAVPEDPAAAQARRRGAEQRAARREERVSEGMAELERWLQDQVSSGLAAVSRDPEQWAEQVAARMVDAQAPGVASALRRLPRVVRSGDGWNERLLEELARLHLLARAWARLAELDEDLAAVVRRRVGFTVTTEELLRLPPVRDRWTVVGLRDTEEDRLTTRTLWLRGRSTGRWASVRYYSRGGEGFVTPLQRGEELDADLHFHPGRPPLRAALGTVHAGHGRPLDCTWPGGTLALARAQWRETLAGDPWSDGRPVVVRGTVDLVDGRFVLTDDDGDAVALLGRWPGLAELLGLTAARSLPVVGEIGPDGLTPTAFLEDGTVVVL